LGVPDGVRRLSRSGVDELRISSETAVGAGLPGKRLEEAFSRISSQSLRQTTVAENLGETPPELCDVPGLDEETGDAVLDHLGKPADPARDDGCPARHRLDGREPKKLSDPDRAAIARQLDGRQSEDFRTAVEGGQVRVVDDTEELDAALHGKPPKQIRIVTLWRVGIVPARADHAQLGTLVERLDQSVDALVRRQPSNEEDAATARVWGGREANRIGSPVDDSRPCRRRSELARRVGRHGEKAVEKPRKKPGPIPAREAVVCDGGPDVPDSRVQAREPARRASQVVHVDDVSLGERTAEPERERLGGVPAYVRERAQDTNPETAGIRPRARR
jgi:hypothetical protein